MYGPTMTVAVYADVTDSSRIWFDVGALLPFLFVYVMVKARYFLSGD